MTYSIEITPERLTVTADLSSPAEIAALIRAIDVVRPLVGGVDRREEITREPRQTKALRAEKAGKEIRPGPQKPADLEQDEGVSVTTTAAVATRPPVDRPTPDDDGRVRRVTKASVPADRDEKLKALWATDLTLQQIADKLGMGHLSNFDPSYYARHAIIPERDEPPLAVDITGALMGDPGHGPSLSVERAGPQGGGGEPI